MPRCASVSSAAWSALRVAFRFGPFSSAWHRSRNVAIAAIALGAAPCRDVCEDELLLLGVLPSEGRTGAEEARRLPLDELVDRLLSDVGSGLLGGRGEPRDLEEEAPPLGVVLLDVARLRDRGADHRLRSHRAQEDHRTMRGLSSTCRLGVAPASAVEVEFVLVIGSILW